MSLTDESTPGIGPQIQGAMAPPPGAGGDDDFPPPPTVEGETSAVGAGSLASPGGEDGDVGVPTPPVDPPPTVVGNAARTSAGAAAQRSASPSLVAMRPFIERIEDYVNASITFEDACLEFAKAVPDSRPPNWNEWQHVVYAIKPVSYTHLRAHET